MSLEYQGQKLTAIDAASQLNSITESHYALVIQADQEAFNKSFLMNDNNLLLLID